MNNLIGGPIILGFSVFIKPSENLSLVSYLIYGYLRRYESEIRFRGFFSFMRILGLF